MAIYCWGSTAHGEMGLGEVENDQVLMPCKILWTPNDASTVTQISCGRFHTLFLTSTGKVYSCGNNDDGQLGHDLPTKRPQPILELDDYVITNIACGSHHSMALNEWGQLFTWGCNDYGQLGLGNYKGHITTPKIVRSLISKNIVQVACGHRHCLALTNCGELYGWGSNTNGQLGVSNKVSCANTPTLVSSLFGIPLAFIACGGGHSFTISKSGAVFGWGRNNCGQLGLNDCENRMYPTQLKTLRSLNVRYVSCGDEFSAFLTNEGGVFTCGLGVYGQLGHGSNTNEVVPRMIIELMGSTITQIACGVRHTLALVPSKGRIYAFGIGNCGQLGNCALNNTATPQVVLGPWVSSCGSPLVDEAINNIEDNSCVIKEIFSGGDHSLVICTNINDKIPATDFRIYKEKSQILHITEALTSECVRVGANASVDMDLLGMIELIFKSQSCLNGSFILGNDRRDVFSTTQHGIDLELAGRILKNLGQLENKSLKSVIWDKITNELLLSLVPSPGDIEALRIYLILPLYHEFVNTKNYEHLHIPFSNAVLNLAEVPKKIVIKWWAETATEWFENLVSNFKNVVAHIISFQMIENNSETTGNVIKYNSFLAAALNFMVFLHCINHSERTKKIDYDVFYWQEMIDFVDIEENYIQWFLEHNTDIFNICNYPFLFNAAAKTVLLQTDQKLQMYCAMHSAGTNPIVNLLSNVTITFQYTVFNISRQNMVQDTLREVAKCHQADLKKPLKIKFYGEEAEDAGGVRKEFFMLLLKDLFDPQYGMFTEFSDTRLVWFSDNTFESENMYFLIGIICGLAIYNFTIINLPFPLALYKKLLGVEVGLNDLSDLMPVTARSLQQLLQYEGEDFEEVFCLNFVITRSVYGEVKTTPLKPNGENIAVTLENKHEFVQMYVNYIFNTSVEKEYHAFQEGFLRVCSGRLLKIFQPEELMAMVVGNEDYDWNVLELNCEYKGGYTASDLTIKYFWEVLRDLPLAEKKKFLLFLTGSDRIPIQGMKAIKILIQPTNDDKFLPVAHTCFNLLDLPRYNTKERLKYKLLQAIQQTQGFSIV